MQLYLSLGPNPFFVSAYLSQKGCEIDTVMLDLANGETRHEPYITWNPLGGTPILALDDGRYLAESIAICEYLEEVLPGESLLGDTAEGRALTRMWLRRVDIMYVQRGVDGFRFAEGLEWARPLMHVVPHAAADFKLMANQALVWIDRHAGPGDYLTGARVTIADILLIAFIEFAALSRKQIDQSLSWIAAFRRRMAVQPVAGAFKALAASLEQG